MSLPFDAEQKGKLYCWPSLIWQS